LDERDVFASKKGSAREPTEIILLERERGDRGPTTKNGKKSDSQAEDPYPLSRNISELHQKGGKIALKRGERIMKVFGKKVFNRKRQNLVSDVGKGNFLERGE